MNEPEKIRVLVVDDEESLLAVLSQVLHKEGYEVFTAKSGETAWELFKAASFPLVITDIVMYGMTGIELLEKIKSRQPDSEVIIMTSYASLDTAVTALRAGAYDYLFKPFEDLEVISSVVSRAVEKLRLQSENQELVAKLQQKSGELEKKVVLRTKELMQKNKQLLAEVEERKRTAAELKQAKEAAERANRAKSDFLANMSHEFRTPLNHIIGFTEVVADSRIGQLNDEQKQYLNHVLQSGNHMLALINDLLDLSKVESGKLELQPAEIDLKLHLESCLNMFKKKAHKQSITLVTDLAEAPQTITADHHRFKQIIDNLLSNALKFTPENGKVSLRAREVACTLGSGRRRGDPQGLQIVKDYVDTDKAGGNSEKNCVEIEVSDNGIGIEPENLDRIFDRFEQVDSTKSRKHEGIGLGLALTKRLVELHGGQIWAESQGKGQGTTFRLLLPR